MLDSDPEGNTYVLGDTPATNILVIKKFSVTGNLLWQTTYDPLDSLRGAWITVDSGGNVIVLASIVRAADGEPQGWLTIKYDTNGNLVWANSLPGPFRGAIRVEADAHNNIYVAGYMWLTNASANTTHDSVLIKYSPSGTTMWTASQSSVQPGHRYGPGATVWAKGLIVCESIPRAMLWQRV